MPNYSLIVNPKYTPLTLEQQIAPLVAYREMWDNQNKAISDLQKNATEASLLLGPNDTEEKEAYDAYKKDIEAAAERLNKVGYDAESERILRNARNVFARDITPIITASKIREEEVNSQLNTLATNPYAKFAMPASSVSLSTYRKDPTFRANKYFVDATKARGVVENMATEVAKQIINKKGKYYDALEKIPGMPFYLNVLRHKGFTPQDLLGNNEILDFIVNAAVDPINANIDAWDRIDDTTKENTKNWVRNIAKQGLTKSIGDQVIEKFYNEYGAQAALARQKHNYDMELFKLQNAQSDDDDPAGEFIDPILNLEDAKYTEGLNEIKETYGDPNSPTFKLKSQYTRSPLTKEITNPVRVNLEYHQIIKGAADVARAINTGKYNKGNFEKTVEYIIRNTNTVQGGKAVKAYLLNSLKRDVPSNIKNKTKFNADDFFDLSAKIAQRKKDFSIKDEDIKWLVENHGIDPSAKLEDINNLLGGGDSPYSRKRYRPYEVQSGDKPSELVCNKFKRTLGDIGQTNLKAKIQNWYDLGEENDPVVWTVENGKLVGKSTDDVLETLKDNTKMNVVLDPQLLTESNGYKIGFNSNNGKGTFFLNASSLGVNVQNAAKQCQILLKNNINEEKRKAILEKYGHTIERIIKKHTQTTSSTSENAQE